MGRAGGDGRGTEGGGKEVHVEGGMGRGVDGMEEGKGVEREEAGGGRRKGQQNKKKYIQKHHTTFFLTDISTCLTTAGQ